LGFWRGEAEADEGLVEEKDAVWVVGRRKVIDEQLRGDWKTGRMVALRRGRALGMR
jgi:hypothetical protein